MFEAMPHNLVQLCVTDGHLYGSNSECDGISPVSDWVVVGERDRSSLRHITCYFTGNHLY